MHLKRHFSANIAQTTVFFIYLQAKIKNQLLWKKN